MSIAVQRSSSAEIDWTTLARYGFKVLRVKLFNGSGSREVDFGPLDKPHYLDLVAEDILAVKNERLANIAAPSSLPDGGEIGTEIVVDAETGDPMVVTSDDLMEAANAAALPPNLLAKPPAVVRVEDFSRLRSALLMRIQYGVVGDHNRAVDPQGVLPDADLTGLATTRPYRALLIAPEHGKVGFLVVEVISRSHAGADLPKRLHRAAHGHNLKIRTQGPVADESAVRALVNTGRVKEVELFKTISTSDAGTPSTRRVKLTFPITVGAAEGSRIIARVKNWLPGGDSHEGAPVVASEEAAALASILWSDAEQLAFDDARVLVVSDATDRRLQPLDRTEGFTYELGDVDLDDEHFVTEVASIVTSLFVMNEMEMEDDWSDWLDGNSETPAEIRG